MSGWTEEMRADAETVRTRLQVGPANRNELAQLVGDDVIRMSYAIGLLREEDVIAADPPLGTPEANRPRRYFLKGGIGLQDVAPASAELPGVESKR